MLKQTIKKWNQSIELYEQGSIQEAIRILTSVDGTSKINYNIGVMYIKSNNYRTAIEYFDRSVEQDKYLASSYFMRGIAHHLGGELNHAIVDYDETISKLRGHEFIDYKQLGLDHKLLLAEVLFNKAIALGRAGSSVATLAIQCFNQPSDSQQFKDQCRKIQDGSQLGFNVRPIPLNVLFKPPRVTEGNSKKLQRQSMAPMEPSSDPPTFILKGPTVSPPKDSPSSPVREPTTSISASSNNSALPPKPPFKPSFGSPTTAPAPITSSQSSSFNRENKALPPQPPPLPSKKLPSRPISAVVSEIKITIKVFYIDRRLIQIPVPCNISTLKQKIEIKFEIKLNNQIELYFNLDNQKELINSQVQLDKMICMEINEIHLRDKEYHELEQEDEIEQQQYQQPVLLKKQTTPIYGNNRSQLQQSHQYEEPIKKPTAPLFKPSKQQFYQPQSSSSSSSSQYDTEESSQQTSPNKPSYTVNSNKGTYPLPIKSTSPSFSTSPQPPKPQYSTLRGTTRTTPTIPSSPPGNSSGISFSTSPPTFNKPRSISHSAPPPAIPARNKPPPQQPQSFSPGTNFSSPSVPMPPRPPRPGLSQSHSPPSNNY